MLPRNSYFVFVLAMPINN